MTLKLRMRGSVYRDVYAPVADRLLEEGDTDLAEALSRVGVRQVGGGHRVQVELSRDQMRRLAEHLPRAHADQLRRLAEEGS